MKIIIFSDNDGCARSIRGNCVQPVVGGSSAMNLDRAQSNSIYTAVMEVWTVRGADESSEWRHVSYNQRVLLYETGDRHRDRALPVASGGNRNL